MLKCLRCEYEWESRINGRPKNCPGCKSPLWDRARITKDKHKEVLRAVNKAKRAGDWNPQPCIVCGTTEKVIGHHEDYDKPLEVVWYCAKHHRRRHVEIGDSLYYEQDSPSLNLRDVPDELIRKLKMEAAFFGIGLRDYCVRIFETHVERNVDSQKNSIAPPPVRDAGQPYFAPTEEHTWPTHGGIDRSQTDIEAKRDAVLGAVPGVGVASRVPQPKGCPQCGAVGATHQKGCGKGKECRK